MTDIALTPLGIHLLLFQVTRPVVNAVNNLMTLDEKIIHQSSSDTGKVLWALNQQISNVQEMHTGNYSQITKNIGIKAVKVNITRVGKSICFGTFAPNTETSSGNADLHENNTKMIDVDDDLETAKTTISVPKAALELYSRGELPFIFPFYSLIFESINLVKIVILIGQTWG